MSFYLGSTKIGHLRFNSDDISISVSGSDIKFKTESGVSHFSELANTQLKSLPSNCFSVLCPEILNTPSVTTVNTAALANSNLKYITVGTVTTWSGVFGTTEMPRLRKITVGQGTDITLGMTLWTATDVIAEGQSGIDELNENIVSGLANNLSDRTGLTTLTVRFSTNIYNILTAETKAAFTAKNWNIGYA